MSGYMKFEQSQQLFNLNKKNTNERKRIQFALCSGRTSFYSLIKGKRESDKLSTSCFEYQNNGDKNW